MSSLNSINSKLNKIKKDFLARNPRKVLMFVEEDNLPIRIVKLQYNKKEKTVKCKNDEEWDNLLNSLITYDRMIFINVKQPKPEDVAMVD